MRHFLILGGAALLIFLVPPTPVYAEPIDLGEQPAGVESGGLPVSQEADDIANLFQGVPGGREELGFRLQPGLTSTGADVFSYGDFYSPPPDNTRVTPGADPGECWIDRLQKIMKCRSPYLQPGSGGGIRGSVDGSSSAQYAMAPEPASLLLIGAGLSALGLWRCRSKGRRA